MAKKTVSIKKTIAKAGGVSVTKSAKIKTPTAKPMKQQLGTQTAKNANAWQLRSVK